MYTSYTNWLSQYKITTTIKDEKMRKFDVKLNIDRSTDGIDTANDRALPTGSSKLTKDV